MTEREDQQTAGCKELWCAVLIRAYGDLLFPYPERPKPPIDTSSVAWVGYHKAQNNFQARLESEIWFLDGGHDFETVCSLANVEASRARSLGLKLMEMRDGNGLPEARATVGAMVHRFTEFVDKRPSKRPKRVGPLFDPDVI